MLKDGFTNANYLNSLFTKKDFDFINSFDDEISNISTKISYQEDVRDKIVQLISSIAEVLKLNDPEIDNYSLYKLSNEVSTIFELVNTNIQLLSKLGNQISSLNSDTVNLLVEIEKANHTQDYYDNNIKNIKEQIDSYSNSLKSSEQELSTNNTKIEAFLSDPTTQKYFEGFNINVPTKKTYDNFEKTVISKEYKHKLTEKDNNTLIISEKDNKVFLPYKVEEINDYLEQFPEQYNSFESVVAKEFILPLNYYMSHPVLARFREAYSLCRDREAKPIFESLKYAMDMMFNRRLNPAIIAACKTQEQLSNYLDCLEKNNLKAFTDFEIKFEINPF